MMDYYVKRTIPRAENDRERAARFARFGVATVSEAQKKTGMMQPEIRPIQQGKAIAGPAVTVLCAPGDNLMLHAAMEVCQPGDVLVVSAYALASHGAIGELLSTGFMAHGVVGAVLDMGVRDTEPIRAMGFPVWARYISAAGNTKQAPGWVNAPITAGGMTVHPGDFVVADDDGVVVVSRAELDAVDKGAADRTAKEEKTRERFAAGELSLDFYNIRPQLKELGIRYLD